MARQAGGSNGNPFREYHRQSRRRAAIRIAPIALALGGIVVATFVVAGSSTAGTARPADSLAIVSAAVPSVVNGALDQHPSTLASQPVSPSVGQPANQPANEAANPTANQAANQTTIQPADGAADPTGAAAAAATHPSVTPDAAAAPARTQQSYSVDVTARGFQRELDACQWVRMDVQAVAPIVGAHTFCGGSIVLDMQPGDLVKVAGTDLDGDYQVSGSRDAHAGDDAASATAGLTADLLLQTCYWDTGLRLVTLTRVDLSLPPVQVAHFG